MHKITVFFYFYFVFVSSLKKSLRIRLKGFQLKTQKKIHKVYHLHTDTIPTDRYVYTIPLTGFQLIIL
jgi:hypothetical protein